MDKIVFQNYRILTREVKQLREQLEALESSLYSPKGQRFTSTPHAASGSGKTMEAAVERHMQLVEYYHEKLAEKETQQLVIERAIDSLEDEGERVVMRDRYIAGHSWRYIVAKMAERGYSERTVYRLHGFALLKLKEV
jgi:chromosome segregation ATPase